MINDIFAAYQFTKELTKDISKFLSGFKNEITYLNGDRWIIERNKILSLLSYSDTYLSICYLKGKNNTSRYWSTTTSNSAKEYEIQSSVLIRRVIVFEDSLNLKGQFITDNNRRVPIAKWLDRQRLHGSDIFTANSSSLLKAIENSDSIKGFKEDSVRRLIKSRKASRQVPVEFFNQLKRSDSHIMDIGIYGISAVGFQVTNEMGEPIGFLLSKNKSDVIEARKYFSLICSYAERY